MRAFITIALLALAACRPLPEPNTPPGPVPDDDPPVPAPDAGPVATACERACARADQLGGCDGAGGPQCPEACERYEAMGGAFARNPECQAKASTCAEHEACRSQ
jgi:hypothetical protein